MAQHLSIEVVLQKLNQSEALLEEQQLENLLEKLENKKAELPIEDHAIIDWGISYIRARVYEEEQLRVKMCEALEKKYQNYSAFIATCSWGRVAPLSQKDQRCWYESLKTNFEEIATDTFTCGFPQNAEKYTRKLKDYVNYFCGNTKLALPGKHHLSLSAWVLEQYKQYCNGRVDEETKECVKYAECWKYIVKGLQN